MWQFETVYKDDGTELSTPALTTTLGVVLNFAYDGRFMWVTCTNGVGIYEFWGESSDNEPTYLELEDLLMARYTEQGPKRKLKLITFISVSNSQVKRSTRYLSLSLVPGWTGGAGTTTVSTTTVTFTQSRRDLLVASKVGTNSFGTALSPFYIAKLDNKMVVSNGANFSQVFVFDIASQRLENVLTFAPESDLTATVANSNLHAQNSKIWVVNTRYSDAVPQRLITKTLGGTETSTNINVRPQSTRAWLANGYNGFVYVTNHNGVSVSRYDENTGILGARIRTSAFPYQIWTTPDRRILVASDETLITTIDWDDDGVHFDNNTESKSSYCTVDPIDGGRFWFAKEKGNKLMRLKLADGDVIEVGDVTALQQAQADAQQVYDDAVQAYTKDPSTATNNAKKVASDALDEATKAAAREVNGIPPDWVISKSLIDNPGSLASVPVQAFGDSKVTRPYLFIENSTEVCLVALDNSLIRNYYDELNGQGAIVGGTLQYFGELGGSA
jgi:hypothetical protein